MFITATLIGLTIAFTASAADCPLIPQTSYRTKAEPAVYFITRQCTKRVFLNEVTYFAYFSSWKDVKITLAKTLASISDDARGPMRVRAEIVPAPVKSKIEVSPTPTIQANTPITQVIPEPTTPVIIQTPIIPILPTTIEKPTLTGVMKKFLDCPTDTERTLAEKDFTIMWNQNWDNTPFSCTYQTTAPNRLPLYATVRLIKQIEFNKPLPFTGGQDLYTYLTAKKITLIPSQNCAQYSSGWDYTINLGGTFAHTHGVRSMSTSCELVTNSSGEGIGDDNFVYNPIYKAATFIHEAHHAITASLHDGINGGDKNINNTSAWAAQFYFYAWVDLYADNVDDATKLLAKNAAIDILNTKFSENKCPTNADLKKVVNTIAPNTCI